MKKQVKKWMSIVLAMAMLTVLPMSAFAATVTTGATENDGVITIEGTVTNAAVGQQITVLVVNENTDISNLSSSDIAYVCQTVPTNGAYSVSFTMPVEKQTGTYDVYVGGTEVGTPDDDSFTFATETPSAAPTTPPAIDMATAKPAVNGSNAFYYVVSITLNDGEATAFTAKHYPSDLTEDDATSDTISLQGIAGTTIKLITVLKDIPDGQEDRSITSKVILTYTIGGNSGTVTDTETTTLNTIKGN